MRWLAFSKMALGLMLATLAAVAVVGINEAGYLRSTEALEAVRNAQKVRTTLLRLMQNILDAETGQRGYLLTGEPSYRAPYDSAVAQVDGRLKELRLLFADQTENLRRLDTLSRHVARKLAEMDTSVRLRRSGDEQAWKFVMTTDVGREEMAAIRIQTETLIDGSNEAVQQGQVQIEHAIQFGRLGIVAIVVAAWIAFWLYLRQTHVLRSIGERQQQALQHERNALEVQVQERTANLKELATHLQEVRETERGYLARELHDELGSLLTAAKLDVARLKSRLIDAPDAMQRLQHLTELLNSGIALKRRIIEDLRPSSLSNLGLVASLEILGREFADQSGLQVEMMLEPIETDESRQLTIYRMVQESLTNIGKYAQATEATVMMKNHQNHATIEVTDNGSGFDMHHVRASTHGLAGMRHRVEAAQGTLTVESAPGNGTRLIATLPFHN